MNVTVKELLQETRAVARKPRDAAAVLFGLLLADNKRHNSVTDGQMSFKFDGNYPLR